MCPGEEPDRNSRLEVKINGDSDKESRRELFTVGGRSA